MPLKKLDIRHLNLVKLQGDIKFGLMLGVILNLFCDYVNRLSIDKRKIGIERLLKLFFWYIARKRFLVITNNIRFCSREY